MMTAMMTKINISYESLMNMEFHTMKGIMDSIVKLSEITQKG